MTPKEQANTIIAKMYHVIPCTPTDVGESGSPDLYAKKCAIICVEQIILELNDIHEVTLNAYVQEEKKHWKEVLEHIKNS